VRTHNLCAHTHLNKMPTWIQEHLAGMIHKQSKKKKMAMQIQLAFEHQPKQQGHLWGCPRCAVGMWQCGSHPSGSQSHCWSCRPHPALLCHWHPECPAPANASHIPGDRHAHLVQMIDCNASVKGADRSVTGALHERTELQQTCNTSITAVQQKLTRL